MNKEPETVCQDVLGGADVKELKCQGRRGKNHRLEPWVRKPGEGNGNPLQYSGLEKLMNRGAQSATVYRVTKSQTRLKRLSTHAWEHRRHI